MLYTSIRVNEHFWHKLRHLSCYMTSSIFPSLSILNIYDVGGSQPWPSDSQNVSSGVMGEVITESWSSQLITNFNVKRLVILSVFANKVETNDRVAKQTRLKMKFHCNQMMNWRWMNEEVLHFRGTQREYISKPLKHSIVKRILIFKR